MRITAGTAELILAVLGFVIVAAGLAGLSFRVNRSQASISQYRDAADAWQKKAAAQAGEISDLQSQVATLHQELAAEREARHVLEGVVTGKSAVDALALEMSKVFASLVTKDEFAAWQAESRDMIRDVLGKIEAAGDGHAARTGP